MASVIDICNLALGHIGDTANVSSIDPPDGTTQAINCARFYAMTRDALLERHAWNFATRREALAELSMPSASAWAFEYAAPADIIRPLVVLPATAIYSGRDDDYKSPFRYENNRVQTDLADASLRFIFRQTDPTKFSPLFTDTLALMLASRLAGPIIKGKEGRAVAKALAQDAEISFAHATASDGNAQSTRPEHVPRHIAARNPSTDLTDRTRGPYGN